MTIGPIVGQRRRRRWTKKTDVKQSVVRQKRRDLNAPDLSRCRSFFKSRSRCVTTYFAITTLHSLQIVEVNTPEIDREMLDADYTLIRELQEKIVGFFSFLECLALDSAQAWFSFDDLRLLPLTIHTTFTFSSYYTAISAVGVKRIIFFFEASRSRGIVSSLSLHNLVHIAFSKS